MTWKFENRAKCYFCSQIFCLSHDVLSSSHHIYPSQSTVAQADMLDNSPGMWDKQYCGRTKMLHLWPYQRSAKFKRLFMLYSHPLWFWHLAFHWSSTLIKRRGEGEGEKKSVSRKKTKKTRETVAKESISLWKTAVTGMNIPFQTIEIHLGTLDTLWHQVIKCFSVLSLIKASTSEEKEVNIVSCASAIPFTTVKGGWNKIDPNKMTCSNLTVEL